MVKQEKIKLSVIIKTKNSDEHLCETLEALKCVDEIIILDNHSTDDTIEIAKEYRAKIIYIDSTDFASSQTQVLQESQNDWILILDEKEIVPYKLLKQIEEYILKPKKNKNALCLAIKTFYLQKEIKSLRQKAVLRVFKKGCAEFLNDYSLELKLKSGKIHKLNKNLKENDNCVLKFVENDIFSNILDLIELAKNKSKHTNTPPSIIIKPLNTFFYWYLFKKGIFDGKYGFMFSKLKFIEEFLINTSLLEKKFKGEKYDIR